LNFLLRQEMPASASQRLTAVPMPFILPGMRSERDRWCRRDRSDGQASAATKRKARR